ncbi:hypothetical protein ACWDTD_15675 [Gordonia sp. NPDC003425]
MARSGGGGGKGGGLAVFIVLILIGIVIKFWVIFVIIAAIALALFVLSKVAKANTRRRGVEQAKREELLARCEKENAAYNQDPEAYLHQLEGDL